MTPRRLLGCLTVSAIVIGALYASAAALPGSRAASWTWDVATPGTVASGPLQSAAATAGADRGSAHEITAADGMVLLVARHAGTLEIGTAANGRVQLEPLSKATGDQAVAVYTAATPQAGEQELVGVARADVDQVDVLLANGSEQELLLNQWRGFSYVAATPSGAAVGVLAYSGGSSIESVRLPQVATQARTASAAIPLYGVFRSSLSGRQLTVAQVDPRTLHQKPGPSLRLQGQWFGPMALSPDGTKLAIEAGTSANHGRGPAKQRLMLVDLSSMKLIRSTTLDSYTQIRMLSWPQQNRLIEVAQTMSKPYQRDVRSRSALIIDPQSGRLLARHRLTNKLAVRTALSTPFGLVLTLGSSGLHGATVQFDLVRPDGSVHALTIPIGATKNVLRWGAVTADNTSGHAYLVVAGGVIFDIDLHTMTLTRHTVAAPAGSSLVPPPVSRLQANMFAGKLAVASLFRLPHNNTVPAQGVYLIDPSTWTAKVLDPTANLFQSLGDRLLTYGITTPPHRTNPMTFETGHGLSLYDENGKLISHLYGGRRFQYVALIPGYGHVIYNGAKNVTLNPRSGRVTFFGPNDELNFNLETGAALGRGIISTSKPPLGPPQLIFRGASAVGESTFG
jgi:hypothetical protein